MDCRSNFTRTLFDGEEFGREIRRLRNAKRLVEEADDEVRLGEAGARRQLPSGRRRQHLTIFAATGKMSHASPVSRAEMSLAALIAASPGGRYRIVYARDRGGDG